MRISPEPLFTSTEIKVFAGKLFDSFTLDILVDQLITVSEESGLILNVRAFTDDDLASADFDNPRVVDLRKLTVLPGLVDAHVHCTSRRQPLDERQW